MSPDFPSAWAENDNEYIFGWTAPLTAAPTTFSIPTWNPALTEGCRRERKDSLSLWWRLADCMCALWRNGHKLIFSPEIVTHSGDLDHFTLWSLQEWMNESFSLHSKRRQTSLKVTGGSSHLFFISRTSLLRVISSACCDEGLCMLPGDAAITMLWARPELGERSW